MQSVDPPTLLWLESVIHTASLDPAQTIPTSKLAPCGHSDPCVKGHTDNKSANARSLFCAWIVTAPWLAVR
eukprot:m.415585 g.415585  ORF g.415585 m.415585 type:complete len:71 (-) comp29685_c0_seq1:604-816(-)